MRWLSTIVNHGHQTKFFALFISAFLHSITMAPYTCWVHDLFKDLLHDSCDEYLQSSDRGQDKMWTKLITRVSTNIAEITSDNNVMVPDNLEKVVYLFGYLNIFRTDDWACS